MSDMRLRIRNLERDNAMLIGQLNLARHILIRGFFGRLKWAFFRK